jgi:hypothetical protein
VYNSKLECKSYNLFYFFIKFIFHVIFKELLDLAMWPRAKGQGTE